MLKINYILIFLLVLVSCTQTHTEYWENGDKKLEYSLKSGKKNGIEYGWFQNNRLQCQFEYKDGLLNGKAVTWYYNGNKESEEFYINNKLNGISTFWSETGILSIQKEYKNGILDGIFKEWYDNGQLKVDGLYSNELFHGTWGYYDPRGIKVGEGQFEKGTGTLKGFYLNGVLKREVPYFLNMKNGEEVWYNESGSIERIVLYKNDRIISN
ncbi:MAG: toxin-antitoxin system YwqK family antitoxin [Bacteroidales bacterium]|nr:toxin-antitoxin system YwqK family antitoxin [Bacteroidales bacterium]